MSNFENFAISALVGFVIMGTVLVAVLCLGSAMDGIECHKRTGFYHCTQPQTNTSYAEIKIK